MQLHRRFLTACTLTAALVIDPLAAAPDAKPDLAELLGKPVSPGTLALLIAHVSDSRVHRQWIEALTHPDPSVRATAARLVYVAGVAAAVPNLRDVLATESDDSAALEQTHALLGLGGPGIEEAIFEAARRRRPDAFLEAVAQAKGSTPFADLRALRDFDLHSDTRDTLLANVVADRPDELNRAAAVAIAEADADLWRSVLSLAYSRDISLGNGQIIAALESSSDEVRDLAWWHVAVHAADEKPVPEPARDKARSVRSLKSTTTPELSFGRELAARVLGGAAPMELPDLLAIAEKGEARFSQTPYGTRPMAGGLYEVLTKNERRAFGIERRLSQSGERQDNRREQPSAGEFRTIRTVGNLPPGYVADVLRQTGCKPGKSNELGGAVVAYTAAGRVAEVRPIAAKLTPACDAAARYITTAALLPPPQRMKPGQRELLLVPMNDTSLQCVAEGAGRTGRGKRAVPVKVGQKIKPPKKTHHVKPEYPPNAFAARKQGVVIVQSEISPTGCVAETEVLKSAGTEFDIAALRAIGHWRFTPTLVGDEPVPVIMTVTVQFALE